jgi:hypothetical protein
VDIALERNHTGGKMEWIIALIIVMIVPIGLIFWWIPHCDAIGVRKAQVREAQMKISHR